MTVSQCTKSAHRSRGSVTDSISEVEHNAPNETTTMSSYGPREYPQIAPGIEEALSRLDEETRNRVARDAQTQTTEPLSLSSTRSPILHVTNLDEQKREKTLDVPANVTFGLFAEQLRQQHYFESRKLLLQDRKRVLQKTITLSGRLHRVSSWIRDGLVEISKHSDIPSFVRVHQHAQNLIDLSYSQWNHELHALDPLEKIGSTKSEAAGSTDILSQLSSSSQADLFDLLSYLRSDPRFLVERFKVLAHPQIVSLSGTPKFSNIAESEYGSLPYARRKLSHKRVQSYSKALEDYASSFERSNPLSFLLFNMYGTKQASTDAEDQLRLSTWSTICAELMLTAEGAYHALLPQLLNSFASLHEWQARDTVEMFLMDILQRGAFLLDLVENNRQSTNFLGYDPLNTPEIQKFFDDAVRDLFAIFIKFNGGFPDGALQFASAVLQKLPLVEQQMRFRGHFFSEWFLDQFVCLMITYPENENMLLKFHVSQLARDYILFQLWRRICARVEDVYSEHPVQPVDPDFRYYVEVMVGTLDGADSSDPYAQENKTAHKGDHDTTGVSITVCISEIVQVLEALSPQAMHGAGSHDPVVRDSTSAFYQQFARASGRFDRLRRDLIMLLEPGSSTSDIHPCQEKWLQFGVDRFGKAVAMCINQPCSSGAYDLGNQNLDTAQLAALRLFSDPAFDLNLAVRPSNGAKAQKSVPLETLFRRMALLRQARVDPIDCIYWEKAVDALREKYPLSILVQDDSAVLSKILILSQEAQASHKACCATLEIQLGMMEEICVKIRATINKFVEQFESLRLKIWYSVDVVLSKHYADAKNVAKALNNMAVPNTQSVRSITNLSSVSNRSRAARSTTSSIFEQPYKDTMNMLKAPSEHGGPKKLADQQIEATNSWLTQNNIDNFCKGEERIHRFCMEVYLVSRKLVGENLSDGPVLWASDLFARERGLYDVRSFGITSAPASTRPASIVSDSMSNVYLGTRPVLRSAESLRMALLEDRRSVGSGRINRDYLPPELASSIGSPGRTYSASIAESNCSIFTPVTSHTRSYTSGSVYSRSASVYNDSGLSRFTDTTRDKANFLENVQQVLACLLLSDLGCPVWSLGSETDAMLESSRNFPAVDSRLRHRMVIEKLLDEKNLDKTSYGSSPCRMRSQSASGRSDRPKPSSHRETDCHDSGLDSNKNTDRENHLTDLSELLIKLSQQVDPVEKLAVAEEFHELSLSGMKPSVHEGHGFRRDVDSLTNEFRRSSLDSSGPGAYGSRHRADCDINDIENRAYVFTETEIVQALKSTLMKLRPKTLFRDLQYISVFVPTGSMDKPNRGKALFHLGLAALAYKDEVCRSMVDVADRMLSRTPEMGFPMPAMATITDFWMFAAREGNPVAQRELASLYLSRPELLPIISLPLSTSTKIFRNDILRPVHNDSSTNTQALCLALHWMKQAKHNGDRLAQQKLEDLRKRKEFDSMTVSSILDYV